MPFIKTKYTIETPTPAFLFVMNHFHCSQADAQRFIGKGRLLVDGSVFVASGEKISGDIELVYFKPKSRGNYPIFQTNDFMLFDKPSGILVHPNKLSTEYSMLDEIRYISGEDANAVHRIDMETSGLLLASKNKTSEKHLKTLFENRGVTKSYLAWVDGEIKKPFEVDAPIIKNDDYSSCKHKVFVHPDGKQSYTKFVPLEYDSDLDATLLACYPFTGRTHQIRVHLFHMKHPILGDPIYGTTFDVSSAYLDDTLSADDRKIMTGSSRLMLHAQTLYFESGARFYMESKADFLKEKREICPKKIRKFN